MKKLTTNDFIEKCKIKFDIKNYNFDNSCYSSAKKPMTVYCRKHLNYFTTTTDSFYRTSGGGCSACKSEKISLQTKKPNSYYIELANKIHDEKYDYSLVKFYNVAERVDIICPIHGNFKQNFLNHYNGHECPKCNFMEKIKRKENFVKESKTVHGEKYTYENINYVNNYTEIELSCSIHGKFFIQPRHHLYYGRGCKLCKNTNISIGEKMWLDSLNVPLYCRQVTIKIGDKNFLVDGFYNDIVYEYWGDFWHGNPKIYNHCDVHPKCGKTYGELYKKTVDKINTISTVYNIVDIWESDWINSQSD